MKTFAKKRNILGGGQIFTDPPIRKETFFYTGGRVSVRPNFCFSSSSSLFFHCIQVGLDHSQSLSIFHVESWISRLTWTYCGKERKHQFYPLCIPLGPGQPTVGFEYGKCPETEETQISLKKQLFRRY